MDAEGNLYIAGQRELPRAGGDERGDHDGGGERHARVYGRLGGSAASVELSNPSGVAVDSTGNLYIADPGNNRVRIATLTGVSCVATINPFALFPPTAAGA